MHKAAVMSALYILVTFHHLSGLLTALDRDIAIMKQAGFNVARMGDLSWDSFEPEQGQFAFEWFDKIMDKMQAADIRVILDIPGSPAPIWLHRRYPGVDIVSRNGTRIPPAERYMDDISDPGLRARSGDSRGRHDEALRASPRRNRGGL
jgi:beta-galactosidase